MVTGNVAMVTGNVAMVTDDTLSPHILLTPVIYRICYCVLTIENFLEEII